MKTNETQKVKEKDTKRRAVVPPWFKFFDFPKRCNILEQSVVTVRERRQNPERETERVRGQQSL